VRAGIHTPDSKSPTVTTAARLWLESGEAAKLERANLMSYQANVDLHIVPLIGAVKLSALTVPMVRAFEDRLRADRSPAIVRRVMGVLVSILAGRAGTRPRGAERRSQPAWKPPPRQRPACRQAPEGQAQGRRRHPDARPMLLTAIFTGLRASGLRGLRWADIDLKCGELHVRQRAGRFNTIGRPKSESGERTVPPAPMLVNTLREWKLACPKSDDLAFPNGRGNIDYLTNIVKLSPQPAQVAVGVVNAAGKAKYPGLHALRHFYASWCINRRVDGGLELPLKLVQSRLGHSNVNSAATTARSWLPLRRHT